MLRRLVLERLLYQRLPSPEASTSRGPSAGHTRQPPRRARPWPKPRHDLRSTSASLRRLAFLRWKNL